MFSKLKSLNNFLLLASILLAFTTFVVQNKFGFGEFVAEGVPMAIGMTLFLLIFLFSTPNKNVIFDKFYLFLTVLYVLYLILITSIYIYLGDQSLLRLIFIYQYLPPLAIMLYANSKYSFINYEFGFYTIAIFASVSAIFSILQFFRLSDFIPIDINRARGLSRSTLNFSSLMLLSFLAAWNIKINIHRYFFMSIIFVGILCSQSRGALLAAIIFLLIVNIKKPSLPVLKRIFIAVLTIILFFLLVRNKYLAELFSDHASMSDLIWRLSNTFNLSSGDNALRSSRYFDVLNDFYIFGRGVGATGPAALRINEGAVHYESFMLALLVHGGLIGFIYYVSIIFSILRDLGMTSIRIIPYAISFLVMMALQQTFETPTVNTIAWLLILLLFAKFRAKDDIKPSSSLNNLFHKV